MKALGLSNGKNRGGEAFRRDWLRRKDTRLGYVKPET